MLCCTTFVILAGGCSNAEGEREMTIQVTSSAFTQDHAIPKKHSGDGEDVSPPLGWSNVPEQTKELALICDDPDAPGFEPWVHWVIYKIPAATKGLPEGVPQKAKLKEPAGAVQGKNSWTDGETTGYRGPKPPPGHGVHHYHFKLYALDTPLDAEPGLDKKALLKMMQGHILAEGELIGTYER
jgi:Raf kinase inhibitor-like YbhB/YbcL family protein